MARSNFYFTARGGSSEIRNPINWKRLKCKRKTWSSSSSSSSGSSGSDVKAPRAFDGSSEQPEHAPGPPPVVARLAPNAGSISNKHGVLNHHREAVLMPHHAGRSSWWILRFLGMAPTKSSATGVLLTTKNKKTLDPKLTQELLSRIHGAGAKQGP